VHTDSTLFGIAYPVVMSLDLVAKRWRMEAAAAERRRPFGGLVPLPLWVAATVGAAGILTVAAASGCSSSPATPGTTAEKCLDRAVFGAASQSLYVLPYPVGTTYSVLQSYCGPYTHFEQLACDFFMPQGSSVTAARGGLVVATADRWADSDATSNHFNYVFIRHDDGSTAFYAHFRLGGLAVQVGDRVTTGQQIGESGQSGTTVPHLHFGVYRTWPVVNGDDLPVNFRNADGPLDARGGLIREAAYTALPY
jgi:hypothetical protein